MRSFACLSLVVLAVGASLVGCGGRQASGPSTAASVRVTERDFHIGTSVKYVPAGDVQLIVRNQGPDDHELIIVHEGSSGAAMPLRSDAVTLNEERLAPVTVGSGLEPGAPGDVRSLRVKLAPGHYLLFCNMAGHYMSGMHTELVAG